MQSKKSSFIEICLSTAIGLIIALAAQMFIFPFYGIHISLWQNVEISFFMTVISVVRGYGVRRLFNWIHVRQAQKTNYLPMATYNRITKA